MVDILALALSHGLLLLAAWRLLSRPELDDERASADRAPPRRAGVRAMRVSAPLAGQADADPMREPDA